ncbi:MAG: hypothetical protein IBX57_05365 [Gammaproteobacteria bacterium]|nr:hypothetical protein [Gammaproteobacteria bacterium]
MTTWYSIELADSEQAKDTMKRIMDAFMPKYVGAGRPLGMAVFYSYDSESQNTAIYFAPKASSLAMQFGASPFDGEFADMDLALLVGDQASIDHLFPDADS